MMTNMSPIDDRNRDRKTMADINKDGGLSVLCASLQSLLEKCTTVNVSIQREWRLK